MNSRGMLHNLLAFVLLLLFSTVLYAGDTGKIAGKITEAVTGDPLPFANIIITATWENGIEVPMNNVIGTAADSDGYYFILNIRPGIYSITASYIGFGKSKQTHVRVDIDKTTNVDIALESEDFQSEDVVITAFMNPKIEVDRTSTKQVFNISEIEGIGGVNDIDDIIELQADVVDGHFRGGRENETVYLLGGASLNNPINSSKAFSPIVTGIKQVEVFTSGFSAEYGNAQSGVVNMVPNEGGDVWSTHIGYSMELPHSETWGGNPYSSNYMPMNKLIFNPEEWLNDKESLESDGPMFEDYLIFWPLGFQGTYADSLRFATMAMKDYRLMARDEGLEYTTPFSSRIDISTGGPITNNIKIFVAARKQDDTPVVPTPVQNRNLQWLSNITAQINPNNKFTLSYSFNHKYQNDVDNDPQSWFDRIFQVPKVTQESNLYGIDYNGLISSSSYFNLSFKVLNTHETIDPEYLDPDKYRNTASNGERIGGTDVGYVGRYRNTPFGSVNELSLERGYESSTTYSFNGKYTSQINKGNMIRTGFQFSSYVLDAHRENNLKSFNEKEVLSFTAFPYEGALYFQDKMEFEGMIANFGLRYDFYNFNTKYYTDLFQPRLGGETKKTKLFGQLSPRIGVSFPISENSVFHLNYGKYVQRASFNRIYYTTWISETQFKKIGNPRLKPEITNAYDVGIVLALPFRFTLDVSAYYKDVKNLVHEAAFYGNTGSFYVGYDNLDYANIRGFHVNLEKMEGNFRTYLNYNYQVSTGKASSPGDQNIVEVYEDQNRQNERDPQDILMDYDRTHRVVFNVSYMTNRNEGPEIFGVHPFGYMNFSTTLRFMSGQPYTDDDQFLGLVYNKRMPNEYDLRIKIQKSFHFSGATFMLYLEGFNLLNNKVYSRNVFDDQNEYNLLDRYKSGERDELAWYDWRKSGGREDDYAERYKVSREQEIYRNKPSYFRLGLKMRL